MNSMPDTRAHSHARTNIIIVLCF
uniref:Uncharacterized protein n=1 Tax=Anguilla anguilla TaxID=7936 RepID=A0A0E9VCE2_ANGAN